MHTSLATAILDQIKLRKLDLFFELEEKILSKQNLDKSLKEVSKSTYRVSHYLISLNSFLLEYSNFFPKAEQSRNEIPKLQEIFFSKCRTMKLRMLVQVNLFQKPSFLHQLTHNMTRDCSLISSEKYKFRTSCVQKLFFCFRFDIQNNICTQCVLKLYFLYNSMNNLLSYCGLTDARMRASEKDIPVRAKRI